MQECKICKEKHGNDGELCDHCDEELENWVDTALRIPDGEITPEDLEGSCPECGTPTNRDIVQDPCFIFISETLCAECGPRVGEIYVDRKV